METLGFNQWLRLTESEQPLIKYKYDLTKVDIRLLIKETYADELQNIVNLLSSSPEFNAEMIKQGGAFSIKFSQSDDDLFGMFGLAEDLILKMPVENLEYPNSALKLMYETKNGATQYFKQAYGITGYFKKPEGMAIEEMKSVKDASANTITVSLFPNRIDGFNEILIRSIESSMFSVIGGHSLASNIYERLKSPKKTISEIQTMINNCLVEKEADRLNSTKDISVEINRHLAHALAKNILNGIFVGEVSASESYETVVSEADLIFNELKQKSLEDLESDLELVKRAMSLVFKLSAMTQLESSINRNELTYLLSDLFILLIEKYGSSKNVGQAYQKVMKS